MIHYLAALVVLTGIGSPSPANTQHSCSSATYDQADASLEDAAGDWRSLQIHQKSFATCDDGALAEGYSDAVVTLLARHWDQFGLLFALTERSPAFRRWVIRHIDASTSGDNLQKIVSNAARCSGSAKAKTRALCREVGKAAAAAISG